MKKTVALLLCCLLLAGSLSALAGGGCTHDGPRKTETLSTVFGCWTLYYQKDICLRCGQSTETLLRREDDHHDGRAVKDLDRGWVFSCARCGKDLTYTGADRAWDRSDWGWVAAETR